MNNTNTPTTTAPLLIDAKAACALLCMGERRLWVLSNCRAIPSYKIGKSRRYSPDELRAWIRANCPTDPGAGDRVRKEVRR
ncbi:MAG: helix-turn-helix domain-containing protein [Phycisphaeraceae bacterium]|nr:helix-turn-helix domain-containing protein [Phycisphaeraceae bacterium]